MTSTEPRPQTSGAAGPSTTARRRIDLDAPFTRADLRAAGLDPAMLRRKAFIQVMDSVWISEYGFDRESRIRGALLLHPEGAYASHLSAAEVLGLPVPDRGFAHVAVSKPEDRRWRRDIKPHVITKPRRVIVVRGIPTTDPIATFIDCAGSLRLVDLVILGDALCRRYRIKASHLRLRCRASTDYYAGLALTAAELVRDGVDSPMETRLRLLLVLAGLPEPMVNKIVRNDDGTVRRRFDLYYELIMLIIEYDGRQHAKDTDQWLSDLSRREEFDDEGYRILVVTSEGIYKNPEQTLERVRRQLIERGMPDVPPIGDGWKEHFPVRG